MNYDFTTRQLFPYSDQWKNGMRGALWYIQELDAIYMIDAQISSEQDDYKQLLQKHACSRRKQNSMRAFIT